MISKSLRIAIVITHPIQYYAPLFRLMANESGFELKVFYTWSQSERGVKYDRDFGRMIEWDIPLLEGYSYEFVKNIAEEPGVHHFNGIQNPDLNKNVRTWKPDFVLIVGWSFRSHLGCMRYFKGKVPVLFRGDSTLLDEKLGVKKILRRFFLTWVYSKVDYALYVGKNNHDYFHKHGLRENQLVWVPQAVDNNRFENNDTYETDAQEWRSKLGIRDSDLAVLFAGKLQNQKDPDFMVRLAQNLPDPRLRLVIVGNGHLELDLKLKASADSRIIFLDFQNQQKMPLVYRLGDIFVLPSRSETWGLSVNEAMASNRPVIVSTQCGCAPDLVEEGITGWIFERGEKGEMKVIDLLDQILQNRTILEHMGEKAAQKLQSYSYPVAIEKIKQLLQNIHAKQ